MASPPARIAAARVAGEGPIAAIRIANTFLTTKKRFDMHKAFA